MSFDFGGLVKAVEQHGLVCRLVVADVQGSAPRETSAAMLIWAEGQSGTIGGGALEFEACERARQNLGGSNWMHRYALGPALGQCCGGNVALVAEYFDAEAVDALDRFAVLRRISGTSDCPEQLTGSISDRKKNQIPLQSRMMSGWFLEPVLCPERDIWIYGAGHVGRALVGALEPFPDFAVTWVDTAMDRFPPADRLERPERLVALKMAETVRYAPDNTEHLILTFSHELDLEICHAVLCRPFKTAGLIGSATKWRRFQKRLGDLGHDVGQIGRIECPIGNPELGKSPQAIAIGVMADLLSPAADLKSRISAIGG